MRNDLKFALRSLLSAPRFTVPVILVLGLGIGASTAIFSVVHAVLFRPLNYPDSDRLYELSGISANGGATQVVPAKFLALRNGASTVESSTLIRSRSVTLVGKEGAESTVGQVLAGDGLRVLGTLPLVGRLFDANASHEVVLSHRLWERRYGKDAGLIGRTIQLNGEMATVVGIMPPDFQITSTAFELWMPWQFTSEELTDRGAGGFPMLARRHEDASEEQVRAQTTIIGELFDREGPPESKGSQTILTQLKERRVGGYRRALWTLLSAVTLVLAIACLNVAGLMITRAFDRSKEVALRIALGASQWRVVRQFLIESVLLSVLGGLVGLLFAAWAIRGLILLAGTQSILPRLNEADIDTWVIVFALVVALITGLAFGVTPAFRATRIEVQDALKQSGRAFAGDRSSQSARRATVALQIAFCVVLITGAGLLMRSFLNLIQTDSGFRPEGVLTARVAPPLGQLSKAAVAMKYASMLDRLQSMPGVRAAALTTVLPLGPVESTTTMAADSDHIGRETIQEVQYRAVSPEYFHTMGIPVIKGRTFDATDSAAAPEVAIVNDVAARKYWPDDNPVGKRVATSFEGGKPVWITVVGVVGGVRQSGLKSEPGEELYRPYTQHLFGPYGGVLVMKATGDTEALARQIRTLLRDEYPNQPLAEIRTMTDWVNRSIARPRFDTTLAAVFASVALSVALVGIYGALSYGVRRRQREFGIRMALGAKPKQVMSMVIKHGIRVLAPGIFVGVCIALVVSRVISSQLYGVESNDPTTLGVGCSVIFATGLLACLGPARRAAKLNSANALREE